MKKKGLLVESGWSPKFIVAEFIAIIIVTFLVLSAVDAVFFGGALWCK